MVFNRKRGQAALEFLTTYGWAFLVILIMIVALAYFGILNPENLVPENCFGSDGWSCSDFVANTGAVNDSFQFVVFHSGLSLTITEIRMYLDGVSDVNDPIVLVQNKNILTGLASAEVSKTEYAFSAQTPVVWNRTPVLLERLEKTLISFNATTPPIQGITYRGKFEIEYIVTGTQLSKIAVFDFVVKAR